jgi:alpha-tubulin suppressor-like RCC1 family protein
MIAAGYAHSLALKSDGTVVALGCGGAYNFGQCISQKPRFGALRRGSSRVSLVVSRGERR